MNELTAEMITVAESIDTNSPLGVALNTILGALAQLEREIIIERVRAGMAHAKAKGKKIDRTKLRNLVLIGSLLEAKISFREIARIAKWSHGSVHVEKIQMQKDCIFKVETQDQAIVTAQSKKAGPFLFLGLQKEGVQSKGNYLILHWLNCQHQLRPGTVL